MGTPNILVRYCCSVVLEIRKKNNIFFPEYSVLSHTVNEIDHLEDPAFSQRPSIIDHMDYEFTDKVNCGAAALLPQKTVTKEPQVIVYLKPFFFVVFIA